MAGRLPGQAAVLGGWRIRCCGGLKYEPHPLENEMSTLGSRLLPGTPSQGGSRQRTNPPPPQNKAANRRRRRQPKNKAPTQNKAPRRAKPRMPGVNPWFLLGEFKVSSSQAPGPLEEILLHPTEFPTSPYATQTAHHTHRREKHWQLEIQVTTATNTGFRAAAILLPDPQMVTRNIPPGLIWSAVLNGTGAMMSSTGTGHTRAKLRVPQTTGLLSNAPPPGPNWTGFAAGSLIIYLLDPPIGLTGTSEVNITILARVDMDLVGPMAGFSAWAAQVDPKPGPPGPGGSWVINVSDPEQSMAVNDHVGSAWLAGGYYWRLDNTRPSWAKGELWVGGVYKASHAAKDWQDNYAQRKTPIYFVIWREPGSETTQVVGFENLRDAKNQADGHTGSVPPQAECCLYYHDGGTAKWPEKWEGIVAGTQLAFTLEYKGENAWLLWKANNSQSMRPRILGEGQGLQNSRLWSPGQIGGTGPWWPNHPPTTLATSTQPQLSLQPDIAALQQECNQLRTLCRQLSGLSVHSPLPPGTPVDPPTPPSSPLRSGSSTPSWTQWWDALATLRGRPKTPPSSSKTSGITSPDAPRCRGCKNLDCDDCFEDMPPLEGEEGDPELMALGAAPPPTPSSVTSQDMLQAFRDLFAQVSDV